jgi:hypothetical protein
MGIDIKYKTSYIYRTNIHIHIMSNAHASKQHGLQGIHEREPKSKLRKRANKAKAAILRNERSKKLMELVQSKRSALNS